MKRVKGIEPSSRSTSFGALEVGCSTTFQQIELALAVVTGVVIGSERNFYGQPHPTRQIPLLGCLLP